MRLPLTFLHIFDEQVAWDASGAPEVLLVGCPEHPTAGVGLALVVDTLCLLLVRCWACATGLLAVPLATVDMGGPCCGRPAPRREVAYAQGYLHVRCFACR